MEARDTYNDAYVDPETFVPSRRTHTRISPVKNLATLDKDSYVLFEEVCLHWPIQVGWPAGLLKQRFEQLFHERLHPRCFRASSIETVPGVQVGIVTGYELIPAHLGRLFDEALVSRIEALGGHRISYVEDLLIHPKFRGFGLERALLEAMTEEFRALGISITITRAPKHACEPRNDMMLVRSSQEAGNPYRAVCEQEGFRELGDFKKNLGWQGQAVLLAKAI